MKWFIKRINNGCPEYLHKNNTWANPILYRWDVLINLDYSSAINLRDQLKEFDDSIFIVNGIIEKLRT